MKAELPADARSGGEGRAGEGRAPAAGRASCGRATPRSGPAGRGQVARLARRRQGRAGRFRRARRRWPRKPRRYSDVVLLGMGGSSLGPEVLGDILGAAPGSPKLHVLDTTDPGQIATVAERDRFRQGRCSSSSSKSGSTMEPELLRAYFFDRTEQAVARARRQALRRCHRSGLEARSAGEEGRLRAHLPRRSRRSADAIRCCRCSAWCRPPRSASMSPRSSRRPRRWSTRCGPDAPPASNPGVQLGVIMGAAAVKPVATSSPSSPRPVSSRSARGWSSSRREHRQAWQGHRPGRSGAARRSAAYGDDRLFVHLHLAGDEMSADHAQARRAEGGGPADRPHPSRRARTTSDRSSSAGRSRPRSPAR